MGFIYYDPFLSLAHGAVVLFLGALAGSTLACALMPKEADLLVFRLGAGGLAGIVGVLCASAFPL